MKKYKEKRIILDKCICRFFNAKEKQIYIKNHSTYLFIRKIDNINIGFFLEYGEPQIIAKKGLKTIKVEFEYKEIMYEIKIISKLMLKLLKFFRLHTKRAKVLSNKDYKCSFNMEFSYNLTKKEKYSSSLNFVYDFNDIYFRGSVKDLLTKQFKTTKLPNVLTKKVYGYK